MLRPEEGYYERGERDGDTDREHPVCDARSHWLAGNLANTDERRGGPEDGGGHVRADEGVDDERRGGEARDEAAPFERGDVGGDDGREQLQPSVRILTGESSSRRHICVAAVAVREISQ